jgi:hypothetical protein
MRTSKRMENSFALRCALLCSEGGGVSMFVVGGLVWCVREEIKHMVIGSSKQMECIS